MMLDADKMVAAASSRNPTLAGALTRLQRCAFSGSWEVLVFESLFFFSYSLPQFCNLSSLLNFVVMALGNLFIKSLFPFQIVIFLMSLHNIEE